MSSKVRMRDEIRRHRTIRAAREGRSARGVNQPGKGRGALSVMAGLVPAIHVAPRNLALQNFHVFMHERWDKAGKSIALHNVVDARDEPGQDDLGRWSLLAIPSAPCSLLEFDSVILRRRLTANVIVSVAALFTSGPWFGRLEKIRPIFLPVLWDLSRQKRPASTRAALGRSVRASSSSRTPTGRSGGMQHL